MRRHQQPLGLALGLLLALLAGITAARETLSAAAVRSPMQFQGPYEHVDNRPHQMSQTASEEAIAVPSEGDETEPVGTAPPEDPVSTLVLATEDSQSITVERVSVTTTAKGRTWTGVVKETGESALLMWWKGGGITGTLGYRGRLYKITNAGGEVRAVLENKQHPFAIRKRSADSGSHDTSAPSSRQQRPAAPLKVKPFPDAERRALEAKKVTIDLMILYTKKAADRYVMDLPTLIGLATEQVNETFRNSGLGNISLRLVHTQLVDYEEKQAGHFEHLYRMVDGRGSFKDVRKLRDEKRADIVGLMLEDPSGCGLSTRVGADAEEAYFVVHSSCAAITLSIAHEIGHIIGARHDRQTDVIDSPSGYAHGYVNGTKWRDIMSYQQSCDGCPRIPYWSNPRVMYKNEPTGTDANDNARVILEQAWQVAKFR